MNSWTSTDSNGTTHSIGCKAKSFGGPEITVDTNTYRVKSSNYFVNVVDYSVDFPGANCHVVMIGKKARLAVNGTYQDDGTTYEPVSSIPAWVWVLVALSVIGGYFFAGIIGLLVGILMSSQYISAALQKNMKKVAISFVIFLVIVIVFFVVVNMAVSGLAASM